ncbi:MAG: hypothetical protein SD837_22075 [Candidatus Electrothrix scaldis]|nr:MAG: hypothetical protein SD837_22075 [Candidatus Electrothrix sp. GW3-3]
MSRIRLFFLSFLSIFSASDCLAAWTWTPLMQDSYFDGIKGDLLTTVSGIVLLLFIILGLGILYRVIK